MTMPSNLSAYLERRDARYELCLHPHSRCSAETARTAHVPPHQLAKAILVEDEAGCVMAVLPADRKARLGELSRLLGRRYLRLADENRLAELLDGCERGAVPALGMAWGLDTVVDDELDDADEVYVEVGDHEQLLRMSRAQFRALMAVARRGHFCAAPRH